MFPDYSLPDPTGTVRTLSELQGRDPLIGDGRSLPPPGPPPPPTLLLLARLATTALKSTRPLAQHLGARPVDHPQVRFTSSGSEAVMLALRLATAATGGARS